MEANRMPILRSHPGKFVWTVFTIALNTVRLPLWMLYYIPTFTRPHKDWSHKQAVRVRIVRAFLNFCSAIEMKTPLSLAPGKEGDRFATLSPAAASSYAGPCVKDPEIRPATIGGTWYPAEPALADARLGYVVLHFHGGAYVIGDGRTQDAGFAAKTLIANTDATHVFAPQYRLASNPGGRFPAQLQDAVTCYRYLVDQKGIDPKKIVLSGDSAGANLVAAFMRYTAEYGKEVDIVPAANAWGWSPWIQPSSNIVAPNTMAAVPTGASNLARDYVDAGFGVWGASSLMPSAASGLKIDDPYISFLDKPFKTETPLYVSTGECEFLYFDDIKWAEQMKGVAGNTVELKIEEHSPHDIILTGTMIGFEKEAEAAAKGAGAFLKKTANPLSKL